MYTDICRDGLRVTGTAIEAGVTPALQFGTDPPITLTAHVRNLRAALTPTGHVAVWKSQDGMGMMCARGGSPVEVEKLHGDESIAVDDDGTIVYVASTTEYVVRYPSGQTQRQRLPRQGTSQGINEIILRQPVFTDDKLYNPITLGRLTFIKWLRRGDWTFGTCNGGGVGLGAFNHRTGKSFQIADVETPWQVQGELVDGELICAISLPGLFVSERAFRLLPDAAPAPTPSPRPHQPPQEPPMDDVDVPDIYDIVQSVRAKYPAKLTAQQCGLIVNEVAVIARRAGRGKFGLLEKGGGNHAVLENVKVSVDWLTFEQNGLFVGGDILGDAGNSDTGELGEANTQWPAFEPIAADDYVAPFPSLVDGPTPIPPPTVPPPTVPPPSVPPPSVDALREAIETLKAAGVNVENAAVSITVTVAR